MEGEFDKRRRRWERGRTMLAVVVRLIRFGLVSRVLTIESTAGKSLHGPCRSHRGTYPNICSMRCFTRRAERPGVWRHLD